MKINPDFVGERQLLIGHGIVLMGSQASDSPSAVDSAKFEPGMRIRPP
jgi:hypothetical protein